jgi:hypothetical protein
VGWTDWVISFGLIVLVLRQIRGKQLSVLSLLWPIGLVAWAGFEYLGTMPGYRSDWALALVLASAGVGLGLGCGLLTSIFLEDRRVMARATIGAAVLWNAGMAARLVFGIVALNGGAETIGRFSARLGLHSAGTWPTALIVMALCEVSSRTVVLLYRYRAARKQLIRSETPAAVA